MKEIRVIREDVKIRMPKTLKRDLEREARQLSGSRDVWISLNAYMIEILEARKK